MADSLKIISYKVLCLIQKPTSQKSFQSGRIQGIDVNFFQKRAVIPFGIFLFQILIIENRAVIKITPCKGFGSCIITGFDTCLLYTSDAADEL